MSRLFILLALALISVSSAGAKIGNTREQNKILYGDELSVEEFETIGQNFTGYISYQAANEWRIKAFYRNGIVRSEHLVPLSISNTPLLSRDEVRIWSGKMFDQILRGTYQKKLVQSRAEGHFFAKGLVAYEYFIEGNATKGYNGVKVLLYENDKSYWSINPKAYL